VQKFTEAIQMLGAETGIIKEKALKLYKLFFTMYVDTKAQVSEQIFRRDFTGLAKSAHQLKGACANLRFVDMYGLALKLELAAKEEKIDLCQELLSLIDEQYEDLLKGYQIAVNENA